MKRGGPTTGITGPAPTTSGMMIFHPRPAICPFGRALGFISSDWVDVHGAGAQRSDPKNGDPGDYPYGRGPQGDAIRIYNYVRLVRGGDISFSTGNPVVSTTSPDGGGGGGGGGGCFVTSAIPD